MSAVSPRCHQERKSAWMYGYGVGAAPGGRPHRDDHRHHRGHRRAAAGDRRRVPGRPSRRIRPRHRRLMVQPRHAEPDAAQRNLDRLTAVQAALTTTPDGRISAEVGADTGRETLPDPRTRTAAALDNPAKQSFLDVLDVTPCRSPAATPALPATAPATNPSHQGTDDTGHPSAPPATACARSPAPQCTLPSVTPPAPRATPHRSRPAAG